MMYPKLYERFTYVPTIPLWSVEFDRKMPCLPARREGCVSRLVVSLAIAKGGKRESELQNDRKEVFSQFTENKLHISRIMKEKQSSHSHLQNIYQILKVMSKNHSSRVLKEKPQFTKKTRPFHISLNKNKARLF